MDNLQRSKKMVKLKQCSQKTFYLEKCSFTLFIGNYFFLQIQKIMYDIKILYMDFKILFFQTEGIDSGLIKTLV